MSDPSSNPLIALLKERNLIGDLQLEEVLQEQTRTGKPVGQILQDFQILDADSQNQIIAEHLGTEVVDVRSLELPPEVIKTVPAAQARMYRCIPVEDFGSVLRVAFADPMNPNIIDELGFIIGKEIQVVVGDGAQIDKAISKYYGDEADSFADILKELGADVEIAREAQDAAATDNIAEITELANETPIIKFVNLVLFQAVQARASDIHFEPFEDEFKIRYRVDGALYEMSPPPKHLALPMISRLKVMANLNISERRMPQDGRIAINLGGKQIDLRVSTLPTQFGESVVLRVLDRSAVNLSLDNLGLPKFVLEYSRRAIQEPNGIFVVTGPTGSGKTTTLYSCLRECNTIDVKILTAEDPVEFDIEGIMQVAVNEGVGMTFMKALRSFLRQDPNGIFVVTGPTGSDEN